VASAADEPFWSFSLALYERPGVAQALIGLQDRLGLDLNVLLYCCWTGTEGRSLTPADLAEVEAAAEPWQAEVVRPLRSIRRRLKGGFGRLPPERVETWRARLGQLEIEAERIAQEAMAKAPRPEQGDPAAASAHVAGNLRTYLHLRGVVVTASDDAGLRSVLRICCPDADLEGLSFESPLPRPAARPNA
jgi:uncharacterized protein (TIGR02444 family)